MKKLPDASIDVILTDPPYLYLKNQKLDRPFDENVFFNEVKRVLKKDGFIILFGRGTSFYRWNTILSDLGFLFKEEIIWDKGYCTSPLMSISRTHETISIYCNGNGKILKNKVPYLEMKKYNISSICDDIKRLCTVFGNPKSLNAVLDFLKNNIINYDGSCKANHTSVSSNLNIQNRCSAVMRGVRDGLNEKSIIRVDLNKKTGSGITGASKNSGSKCVTVAQSLEFGMNEKSIIKENPDHYLQLHPTQKPVRLLERLLNLVCMNNVIILDPFSGSGSTAVACLNTDRNFIGFEIDKEYYDASCSRIDNRLGLFK